MFLSQPAVGEKTEGLGLLHKLSFSTFEASDAMEVLLATAMVKRHDQGINREERTKKFNVRS